VNNCQKLPKVKTFSYFESCGLSWSWCVEICIDVAPSTRSSIKGFATLLKEKNNSDVITTHCFLHREVLASKIIGEDLKQVLDVTVNMASFIKQHPLKSRTFTKLCDNMQKDHVTFLRTEVRWLSEESFNKGICAVRGATAFLQR
jgi:hypothetical protein